MFHLVSNLNVLSLVSVLLLLLTGADAEKRLYSNSLVNCMKNNSDIIPNYFNVTFDALDRSITYDVSLAAKIQGKLKAHATVYAFGFDIIHESIDLCSLNLKQFCPITPSQMEVESVEYISKNYVDMIPDIAFTFPNLDAVARLIITNENNEILGCLQASFNNGKSVSHEGAKWATAVVAGLGLLVSAVLSMFGNSASASRMSAAAISLFTYFQSVVIISMISVDEVPPIANAWAENLAWSMGLIRITFMQDIFRWYVQATGGTPTQYLTAGVKSILTQRSAQKIFHSSFLRSVGAFFLPSLFSSSPYASEISENSLMPRDPNTNTELYIPMDHVESNNYLLVLRGINRLGYDSNIEPSSIVCTGFTFFVLCLYVLVGVFFTYRYLSKALTKGKRDSWISRKLERRTSWQPTFKGILARYIYIGYPQLLILSLWEFTKVDSGSVVTIAVFFLILSVGAMAICCFQVLRYGSRSIKEHGNPAAILYGNPEVLSRYGFLYTMLNARKYWFCAVSLSYVFVKALFVSLSQSSGRTQAMALWIIDMFYLGLMCHFLPYLDKFTNVLTVFIQLITTINSFFFTFFSGIYNQPFRVASVMGLIFFIMNAAVSLLLLIVILILALFSVFSKNPDARFAQTKDDRTSFQRKHRSLDEDFTDSNELFELGRVAKEHDDNWATNMYNLRDGDMLSSSEHPGSPDLDGENKGSDAQMVTNETGSDDSNKKGLTNLVGKLTRGKSLLGLKRGKSTITLPGPDNIVDSRANLHDDTNPLSMGDTLEVVSTGPHNPIGQSEVTHKTLADTDPFQSSNSISNTNPFESTNAIPSSHIRSESHISGVTNGTAGGLSVYGERINPNDYLQEDSQQDFHKFGIGMPTSSSHFDTHPSATVEEESEGNTSYYDDIDSDSEESDAAHRRFR